MSSPARTPLLNLSNKRRKSVNASARNQKDKDRMMHERGIKEKGIGRDSEIKGNSELEIELKAALKVVVLENDVVTEANLS